MSRSNRRRMLGIGLMLCLSSMMSVAMAQVTINSGNVLLYGGPFPSDLREGALENDNNAWLFVERPQPLTLQQDIIVNAINPGTYDDDSDLGSYTIPSGTTVFVFLLHSDPTGEGPVDYQGSITFDYQIVGVIARGRRLRLTDPVLGNSSTLYSQSDNYRGYELDTQDVEYFSLSNDMYTLNFYCRTTNVVDELRILTVVPEPAAVSVLCTGLAALILARKAKKTP